MSLLQWMTLVKDATIISALVIILWGGATRKWVWGHHYLDVLEREKWWRDYATSIHALSEAAVRIAERRRPA